ncbi:unnamed protein product [Mycena citricolor]|uniref:RING-type E3 ubiquitin transferase n=1 Tax=Mycena citricolor TaxID=2018698 RepID=A0AAD2HDT3_9AGAR|nr:unnamed protein product [Mycena citricolor]
MTEEVDAADNVRHEGDIVLATCVNDGVELAWVRDCASYKKEIVQVDSKVAGKRPASARSPPPRSATLGVSREMSTAMELAPTPVESSDEEGPASPPAKRSRLNPTPSAALDDVGDERVSLATETRARINAEKLRAQLDRQPRPGEHILRYHFGDTKSSVFVASGYRPRDLNDEPEENDYISTGVEYQREGRWHSLSPSHIPVIADRHCIHHANIYEHLIETLCYGTAEVSDTEMKRSESVGILLHTGEKAWGLPKIAGNDEYGLPVPSEDIGYFDRSFDDAVLEERADPEQLAVFHLQGIGPEGVSAAVKALGGDDVGLSLMLSPHGNMGTAQRYRTCEEMYLTDARPPAFANPPADLQCSVCYGILSHPVKVTCGHEFCYGCIRMWIQEADVFSCPMCRALIKSAPWQCHPQRHWCRWYAEQSRTCL